MSDKSIETILEVINPPSGFQPWHGGPTLMGALRGVDHMIASWKLYPDRHSIWELALHIAYWEYAVRRYLDPEAEKGFPRSPANWIEITDISAHSWKKDKELIKNEHEKLVTAIEQFPKEQLDKKIADDKDWTYRQLVVGIATHDVYHIGQIQLMKRLYTSSRTTKS